MPDLSGLRDNQLDDATSAWFLDVLRVIESLDAEAYAALMSEDVELRLPDGTVLHGRRQVTDTLGGAWTHVRSLVHHEKVLAGSVHHLVHEAVAVTVTDDGQTVTAATTSWIDRGDDGLITSARVYA